jgi:putative DNA primase/helicase
VSLLKALDREENAPARGFYLTAWGGRSGYTFDRIIRGRTHVEAACVSMLGSTQPGCLAEYIDRALNDEAGDDGMIQRFGLLVWPDGSPEWRNVDRYPNTAARQVAWDTFQRLDQLTPESVGAERDPFETIPFLRYDDEALELFEGWRAELELKLRSGEMHPALEGHLAKYKKLVPALALIGHLAEGGTEAIGANPLLRALAFGKYLESHARRCYGAGREVEATAARLILAHIRRGNLRDGFTSRDVQRHGWSGLTRIDLIKAGLALLVDLGWLAETTSAAGPAGGRTSSSYSINPRAGRQ